jgi:hypothetical protein
VCFSTQSYSSVPYLLTVVVQVLGKNTVKHLGHLNIYCLNCIPFTCLQNVLSDLVTYFVNEILIFSNLNVLQFRLWVLQWPSSSTAFCQKHIEPLLASRKLVMVLIVHQNTFLYFDICCQAVNRVLNFTDTDADLEGYLFVLVSTFYFLFSWFFHLFLSFHLGCRFSIAYCNLCPCCWYGLWYGNAGTIQRHIFLGIFIFVISSFTLFLVIVHFDIFYLVPV